MDEQRLPENLDTILCDDIRREVNNKITLIGIYGNKIIVPDLPFLLGHLGILQLWRGGNGKFNVHCAVLDPDGTELARTPELPLTLSQEHGTTGRVIISFGGVKIEKAGTHKIVTTFNGEKIGEYGFMIEKAPPGFQFQ